jgi:hypothetical protein
VDAKDRLRRYLEQRRELGESELVLDSLSIDDVMKMVGAKSSAYSCSLRTGISRPSATRPRIFASASSSASSERVVWMW